MRSLLKEENKILIWVKISVAMIVPETNKDNLPPLPCALCLGKTKEMISAEDWPCRYVLIQQGLLNGTLQGGLQ